MIRPLILGLLILFVSECDLEPRAKTPVEFLYLDTTSKEIYAKSKQYLEDTLHYFISKKKGPYYPKKFDETTLVAIDTLLLSPRKDRFFFIGVLRNSNHKLLSGGSKAEFYYDANSFVGKKNALGGWDVRWLDAYNLTQYPSAEKASNRMRQIHFEMFAVRKHVDGKSLFKYNVNDKRFWDGPVWDIYYD